MSETSEKSFKTIIEFHLLGNGYLNVPKNGFDREHWDFGAVLQKVNNSSNRQKLQMKTERFREGILRAASSTFTTLAYIVAGLKAQDISGHERTLELW